MQQGEELGSRQITEEMRFCSFGVIYSQGHFILGKICKSHYRAVATFGICRWEQWHVFCCISLWVANGGRGLVLGDMKTRNDEKLDWGSNGAPRANLNWYPEAFTLSGTKWQAPLLCPWAMATATSASNSCPHFQSMWMSCRVSLMPLLHIEVLSLDSICNVRDYCTLK